LTARGSLKTGVGGIAGCRQARSPYTQFRATLIAAEAASLTRGSAATSSPASTDDRRIVPVSVRPGTACRRLAAVRLAEQNRPDIIELKIIIEASSRSLQAEIRRCRRSMAWRNINGTA